ncbi:MAG: HPr family phosphocarrier protein [Phycisphaerae bacterium]|nr:HPr family phosphocarrier protein [Phycisphaerae bacterium]
MTEGENHHSRREATIVNRQGLHARPVMRFVDLASQFESTIRVEKGAQTVDGKSPMEMILLEATQGTTLTLVAQGNDAEQAIDALAKLIADGFNED